MEYQTEKEYSLIEKKLSLIKGEIKNINSFDRKTISNFIDYMNYLKDVENVLKLKHDGMPFYKISDKLKKSITWVTNRYWSGMSAEKISDSAVYTITLKYSFFESKIRTPEKLLRERVMEYLEKNGFELVKNTLLYSGKNKFSVDIIAKRNGVKYFLELKVGFDNHALQRAIGQIIIYKALQKNQERCKYLIVFQKEHYKNQNLKSITSDDMLSEDIVKSLHELDIKIYFFENKFYPELDAK